jgi:hypothetical protein
VRVRAPAPDCRVIVSASRLEGSVRNDNLLSPDDASPVDDSAADPAGNSPANGPRRSEALLESACLGSGIGTVYKALDRLVDLYALDDAALVLDVPGLGRQVLHAGRKPLGNDEHGLLRSPPGLYLDPPLHDAALDDLMVTVGALGLRFDTRTVTASPDEQVTASPDEQVTA